jgi:hypothetical protein
MAAAETRRGAEVLGVAIVAGPMILCETGWQEVVQGQNARGYHPLDIGGESLRIGMTCTGIMYHAPCSGAGRLWIEPGDRHEAYQQRRASGRAVTVKEGGR